MTFPTERRRNRRSRSWRNLRNRLTIWITLIRSRKTWKCSGALSPEVFWMWISVKLILDIGRIQEKLVRAAVVQSLVQVDGINAVRFMIAGEPFKDSSGMETGP